jgi:two-component system KDP operon response regulator KdpE
MTGVPPQRVLVVDDEPAIRRFLRASLTGQGYQVSEADSGPRALEQIAKGNFDAIVLDLGLPGMDGMDVIRDVRTTGSAVPIIVLSVRGDETSKVKALDLGADDYLTKPFGIDELLARLRTAARHRLHQSGEHASFHSGELSVDLVARLITLGGREIKLTPREYDLLRLLIAHAGRVLTHQFILREVWGGDTDVQYLRIYIRGLRQKLEANPQMPTLIMTEQGVGYRLRAPD